MGTRRRNTELGLLVMAVIIIGAAYTLATLAADKQFPADIGPFLLIVLGMLLAAHLVVRRLAPTADPILLPSISVNQSAPSEPLVMYSVIVGILSERPDGYPQQHGCP